MQTITHYNIHDISSQCGYRYKGEQAIKVLFPMIITCFQSWCIISDITLVNVYACMQYVSDWQQYKQYLVHKAVIIYNPSKG